VAIERIRQILHEPIEWEQIKQYQTEGWRPVAVEWERPVAGAGMQSSLEAPPYGLRVAKDCATLEDEPNETEILFTMMELMIQDGPYSLVADELNSRGFATRHGGKWSAVSVFEMLPRLIEAGPKIFSSAEWQQRRQRSRLQHTGSSV